MTIRETIRKGLARLTAKPMSDKEYAAAMRMAENAGTVIPPDARVIVGKSEQWVEAWIRLEDAD